MNSWQPHTVCFLRLNASWPGPVEGDLLCTPAGASYRALAVYPTRLDDRYLIRARRLEYRSVDHRRAWLFRWLKRCSQKKRGSVISRPGVVS